MCLWDVESQGNDSPIALRFFPMFVRPVRFGQRNNAIVTFVSFRKGGLVNGRISERTGAFTVKPKCMSTYGVGRGNRPLPRGLPKRAAMVFLIEDTSSTIGQVTVKSISGINILINGLVSWREVDVRPSLCRLM